MGAPRIIDIELDERTIIRRSDEIEQERKVAIFDLLEGNFFQPEGQEGPFRILLRIEDNRLAIEVKDEEGRALETIRYFAASKGQASEQLPEFRRRFDLMAVQRNLKALGTFGFQASARGNTAYVQYVARTLRHVRSNLTRYPRFSRLHGLLAEHLEELR